MKPAPIPANDQARLAELRSYGLLDTPPDQDFDDISNLACSIAATPIGVVSLVDENRQWFKSCIGLGVRETPRTISFCGHAILQPEPMLIGDALMDERFRDNPLVLGEPHIRFYGGFPLISSNGLCLGTLCIIDQQPRQLEPAQLESLQRLARLTVQLMELRRESHLLTVSQEQIRHHQLRPKQRDGGHGRWLHQPDELIRSLELMVSGAAQPCFAVLRIGLKDLLRLQSSLGEAVTQQLRQSLTQRLQPLLPADASVAWLRESELVVVLPYASDETALTALATSLCQVLEEPVNLAGRLLSSKVAIGIAVSMGNYQSAEALLADAAIAQRNARSLPGSRVSFIDLSARIRAQDDIQEEANLRRALLQGELEPYFQPLVDLKTGAVVGLEALVRWRDRNGNVIGPATVLAAAERADLSDQLDLQLIGKSLAASTVIAAAQPDRPLLLSVNLSTQLLENANAREQLLARIEAASLPTGWTLQVEVTEGALEQSDTRLQSFLEQLQGCGIQVAIDDFGTGYSSLSRLHRYHFHCLKIDASFLARINDPDQPSNQMLKLMQKLGRDLGMRITAEGIETEAQRHWVTQQDFDWGQGFLFGLPMPLDALLLHLANPEAMPAITS